ncbi:FecR family protein [Chitinophaga defluvii]|uniref:FecR family protein n=1 Tax=Chitinophaga defluvii TaxID=3163343 RepID=A0ABV2T5G1_9BACT
MEREEIYSLLQQYQQGKLSTENTLLLYTWLDQVAAHPITEQLPDADANAMKMSVWEHISSQSSKPRVFWLRWKWAATAAILLLLGITYLFRQFIHQAPPPIKMLMASTGQGQMLSLQLPDSSVIWLNANTTLEYPETFSDTLRKVVLVTGEAYFDIRENPHRPFVVQSNHLITKVLGTTFKIRTYKELPDQVAVGTGKVSVATTRHRYLSQLTATDRLVYHAATDSFDLDSVTNAEVADWIQGNIVMTSASIQDVLKELEGIYSVQFITSRSLEKGKLSIAFKKGMPLEQVLQMIERVSVQPGKIHFRNKEAGLYEVY